MTELDVFKAKGKFLLHCSRSESPASVIRKLLYRHATVEYRARWNLVMSISLNEQATLQSSHFFHKVRTHSRLSVYGNCDLE
jgi:hypothetical protein